MSSMGITNLLRVSSGGAVEKSDEDGKVETADGIIVALEGDHRRKDETVLLWVVAIIVASREI